MDETEQLIAELRRYLAWDVPTGIAVSALDQAFAEYGPTAPTRWLVEHAAYLIKRAR